jgi:hypothetical protein
VWSLPGAPDRERAVARPVEVESNRARDERRVERLGAVEALLLRDREEELERPVLDGRVVDDGLREGDADPVVRSESRSVGAHPVVVDADVDPTLPGIERGVGIALAHHVEVGLHYDRRSVVAPARRRDADDDVPFGVRGGVEVACCGPCQHVLPRRALLLGGTSDAGQLEEALPDERRFEAVQGGAQRRRVSAAPAISRPSPSTRGHVKATRSTPNQP